MLNDVVFLGRVPKEVAKILYGANLSALSKPDGDVRPIAVGAVWRRLASKILMRRLVGRCQELFHPNQLGVGTPKGAEAAAHAIRSFTSNAEMENHVVLKVDLKNAFNCISRHVLLQKVKDKTPEMLPYVFQCYSSSTNLFFGEKEIIKSKEGIQQGDPLGPFLFSLVIQELVKSCESPLNIFYLDDGTLGGPE